MSASSQATTAFPPPGAGKVTSNLRLRVVQTTVAKQSTAPAKSLPKWGLTTLHFGEYPIIAFRPVANNHYSVSFVGKLPSVDRSREFQTWVVWGDDIEFVQDGKLITPPSDFILPVPFFAQVSRPGERSNLSSREQDRICNSSSCAMVAKFLGAKISGDEDYLQVVHRYGDTTEHEAQTKALLELGITSVFHEDLDFEDLDRSLANSFPLVLGVLHRGPLSAPTGGHMMVCLGKTKSGHYVFNDPYGSLNDPGGPYTGDVNNGQHVIYTRSVLEARWLLGMRKNGWGRVFS